MLTSASEGSFQVGLEESLWEKKLLGRRKFSGRKGLVRLKKEKKTQEKNRIKKDFVSDID